MLDFYPQFTKKLQNIKKKIEEVNDFTQKFQKDIDYIEAKTKEREEKERFKEESGKNGIN